MEVSLRLDSSSSMTPLPPVCRRKCWKALLKSGWYFLFMTHFSCNTVNYYVTTYIVWHNRGAFITIACISNLPQKILQSLADP